jgi:hypothetical protein
MRIFSVSAICNCTGFHPCWNSWKWMSVGWKRFANSFLSARVVAPSWSVIKSKVNYIRPLKLRSQVLQHADKEIHNTFNFYQYFSEVELLRQHCFFQKDISQQLLNRSKNVNSFICWTSLSYLDLRYLQNLGVMSLPSDGGMRSDIFNSCYGI